MASSIGTMNPTDAAALAALETQLRQLASAAQRLGLARSHLLPATSTFWGGDARRKYDEAVRELDARLLDVIELLRFAVQNVRLAIGEVEARG